jgi:hypothetical protein
MIGTPCYQGLRLDGPRAEVHRAVDRLRWDIVPAPLERQPASPATPRQRHRQDPGDGQAALVEEVP